MKSMQEALGRMKYRVRIDVESLCAAALLVGLVAPATAASSTTFTSKRFAYSVALPAGWIGHQTFATYPWAGEITPAPDGQTVDWLADNRGHRVLAASMPVPATMTLAKWKASMIDQIRYQPLGPCVKNAARFRTTSLGGAPAFAFGQLCPIGDVTMIVALHKRRGYILIFQSPPANTDASDHRLFEQLRKRVRLLG